MKYVALLRGVNVGGNRLLPMKSLAAMFVAAGCSDVATYIQSGNVVFEAPAKLAGSIPDVVRRAIEEAHGFAPIVVVRTAAEMRATLAGNPFLAKGFDAKTLHVMFLETAPAAAALAKIDAKRSPGDAFEIRGREMYLHLPNGVSNSKLTNAYVDSKLATTSTGRNWATILKLVSMLEDPATPR